MTGRRGYVVLGTPRSGTSHLCRLLAATGVLGRPREYLNPAMQHLVADTAAAATGDMWESIYQASHTPNGVWALKTFHEQLAESTVWRRVLASNVVFISRNDKLGQAISLARARRTGQWTATDEPCASPVYDAAQIDRALYDIVLQEATLRQMLARAGTRVLWLVYEQYHPQPDTAVAEVAQFVGVTDRRQAGHSPLTIQRDQISEDWRRRYLAERADFADFPLFEPEDRWSRAGRLLRRAKRSLPLLGKW